MARSYLLGAALVLILGVTLTAVLPAPTTINSSWSEMTTPKPVSSIYWSCDFEQPTSNDRILGCGIQQPGLKRWRRWRGETPSPGFPGVVYAVDKANTGDYYIYFEAPGRFRKRVAQFHLPRIGMTGKACLEFAYNMFGKHMGELYMSVNQHLRWTYLGVQGQVWKTNRTQLHLAEGDYIWFTAIGGLLHGGYIGLDSLVITTGDC